MGYKLVDVSRLTQQKNATKNVGVTYVRTKSDVMNDMKIMEFSVQTISTGG